MSRKVNRNDPCPCGSGKKYKKCCLLDERRLSQLRAANREVMQEAVNWIALQHGDAMNAWIEHDWFEGLSDDERRGLSTADPAMRAIHDTNIMEFMVAEGVFNSDDAETPVVQLILDHAVELADAQRRFLEQLRSRPLCLYRVQSCQPGSGFQLVACDDADGESVAIEEKWASRMLDEGDVVGLRLVQTDGVWETTGAVYYFPPEYVAMVSEQMADAEDAQKSRVLVRNWLGLVAAHV